MRTTLEKIAVQLSTSRSRREMIKSAAATLFTVAVGDRVMAAQSPNHRQAMLGPVPAGKWRTIEVRLYGEKITSYTTLMMPERAAARVTLQGHPTVALVSQLVEGAGVELSIYEHTNMKLARRVTLGLDEAPVEAAVSILPGILAFAAGPILISDRPATFSEEDDCCASCCWGGSVCGCRAICDTCNPGCGFCCDAGCC